MKILKTLPFTLSAVGAETNAGVTEVDLSSVTYPEEFILTAKAAGNATSVGAARTVTGVWWFSDEPVAVGDVATRLADRAANSGAKALTDAANAVDFFKLSGTLRKEARYLYVAYSKTAQDAGSSVALSVNLVRLPSTARVL
jgi:hypothetical protein